MLLRPLALSSVLPCPGDAAVQLLLPPFHEQCRQAASPEAGIAACTEALKSPDLLQTGRARTLPARLVPSRDGRRPDAPAHGRQSSCDPATVPQGACRPSRAGREFPPDRQIRAAVSAG